MFWQLLGENPLFYSGFLFVLGLLVGSFLNVVIHRLPRMIEAEFRQECRALDQPDEATPIPRPAYNLMVPRSACPSCGRPIRASENIPVVSYLLLKGRCKGCGAAISLRYPAVELLTAILTAAVGWYFGPTLPGIGAVALTWALIALFFIDADTYLLPDSITLPLVWLGLLINLMGGFVPLQDAVLGAVFGYLSLWSIYWLFKLVTGKEGMGYGDFKLLAALGAWFGWQALPLVILLSSVAGAVIGIALAWAARRGFSKPMPFGPYLAVAGWLVLIWGASLQHLIFPHW
ncbi:prepilin peptidase [Chitiniphilus shinanonensis]